MLDGTKQILYDCTAMTRHDDGQPAHQHRNLDDPDGNPTAIHLARQDVRPDGS
ncbi:hypothetical protein STRTUCAR8_00214 [Streptomyces turgidiscabies Car8]|uniref:Uncharacterized protein n=1 Tax=Streptomyces turgidiscabies (strain Car8) TaxID=698760 RepID=L7ET23_STRT8|nr:hypothetical protein STRTUCAR8_00214 [Streptomyces turgidiscabies Car8]